MDSVRELFPGLAANLPLKRKLEKPVTAEPPEVSHAYIIEGAQGSGRHTLARSIAASLICENRRSAASPLPCGKCLACRKLFGGLSPDLSIISPEGDKAGVGVDQIRDLRRDIHIYPSELDYKFYIVENADKMTVQAQNAFLLTLEEPPAYGVMFLLCENSGSLLETVRSRAQTLRLEPLRYEENRDTVLRIFPGAAMKQRQDPTLFEAALLASGGSPGRAVQLLSSEEGVKISERREEIRKIIALCQDRRRSAEVMCELVSYCNGQRDTAQALLSDFSNALRDLILLKKSEDCELLFFTDRAQAAEQSDAFPIKRIIALSDAVNNAREAIDRSMNVRLTLMNMLADAKII